MNNDKILVEIAAYCDPELLNTVNSALIQADNPDRISFSICYQSDNVADYEELKKIKNCKIKWLKEKEARGSCYARYLCQQMIEDEEYIFQVDAHMRFVKHWDTKLIEELLSLNDPKAVISFYPPNCSGEMMEYDLDDKVFDEPGPGGLMCVSNFHDDSPFMCVCCETLVNDEEKNHKRSTLISAGNFFSFSRVHKEIIHDPDMYFYGDESYMSMSLYTHGWNVYNSTKAYVYHEYLRKNQKFPSVNNAMKNEKDRFLELLNHRNDPKYIKKYNLGTERTIDDYEKFLGIDFKKRIIYLSASTGMLDNEEYHNLISFFNKKDVEKEKFYSKKEKIEVLLVDIDGSYKECINNCLENSSGFNKISFIVGSIGCDIPTDEERKKLSIKEFLSFDEKSHYCEMLSFMTKFLGNDYTCVVDSGVRFLNDWDTINLQNIKKCGNSAVLTDWVWMADKESIADLTPYHNIEKNIIDFNYYLPTIAYNSNLKFEDIKYPYETEVLFDGFIFCKSSIIKKIPVDPNIRYDEHKALYSLRLWTSGINIYIPPKSYFYRINDESLLNTISDNYDICYALFGIQNTYSRAFVGDYSYDIGNERPLWAWYKFINLEYNPEKKELIKKTTDKEGSDV